MGSPAKLFHALIEAFESGEVHQQQQQAQTIGEVAQTFNWFTSEIQSLRNQVGQLEQERERLQAAQTTTEELNRLRGENEQLRRELQDPRSLSERLQRVLAGSNGATVEPVNQPTPTHPTATAQPTPAIAHTPVQSVAQQIQPTEVKVKRTRVRQETTEEGASTGVEKLNQILDAIMAWNTAQERPDQRLRISYPVLKCWRLRWAAAIRRRCRSFWV